MGKTPLLKKILALLLLLIALIPPVSLTEWACDQYHEYAVEHPETPSARWLLWQVAWTHGLMNRDELEVDTYALFYETYKVPFDQISEEDERVALARYRQATGYYSRLHEGKKIPSNFQQAHRYYWYFVAKYEHSEKVDPKLMRNARDRITQTSTDGRGYGVMLRGKTYPAEYGPGYLP